MKRRVPGITIKNATVGFNLSHDTTVDVDSVVFENVQMPFVTDNSTSGRIRGSRIINQHQSSKDVKSYKNERSAKAMLPVFCEECKSIFLTQKYLLSGSPWDLSDNEEICRNCQNPSARLSEGIFDLSGDAVRVLSAPDMTHAMLKAVASAADDLVNGKASPDLAIAEIERISPKLATVFHRATKFGAAAIMFVAAVVSAYYGRESARLANEQVELQKNSQTDTMLKDILSELKQRHFDSRGVYLSEPNQNAEGQQSPEPTRTKSSKETGSIKFSPQKKPKARHLKRRKKAERRREFNSRHPRSSCD